MNRQTLPHNISPLLRDIPHAFFTRQGGVSEGIYTSLNAGVGSDDVAAHVEENRNRLAAFFGCGVRQLATLRQVHSAVCITIDAGYDIQSRTQADAFVTREHGIVLGILTADCVPILFYDPIAEVIGAAHAGWKGALGGVIEATVQAMRSLGSDAADIRTCIGASIGVESYEVDGDFRALFIATSPAWAAFFIPSPTRPATHFHFDNKAHARSVLASCGVVQIDALPHDTYADAAHYYSFRRATHLCESDYGRQMSAIML